MTISWKSWLTGGAEPEPVRWIACRCLEDEVRSRSLPGILGQACCEEGLFIWPTFGGGGGIHTVTNTVTGTAQGLSSPTDMSDAGSISQDTDVPLPYTKSFQRTSESPLVANAQNSGDSGDITCTICADGVDVQPSTSMGGYAMCQASTRLPRRFPCGFDNHCLRTSARALGVGAVARPAGDGRRLGSTLELAPPALSASGRGSAMALVGSGSSWANRWPSLSPCRCSATVVPKASTPRGRSGGD